MLEVRGVTKVYETGGIKRTVLNNVSINFRESEFAAILGPSGSGKTTFLNIVGGLDHYTTGDLVINERSTKKFRDKDWDSYRNHRIGFVFQNYNLIPHQTVLQNVRLALTLSGFSKKASTKRAIKALTEVGLKEHIYKRPNQLSGGQMQRVAIARALVNDPDILLADEPTGALDSATSIQIMELLKKIAKKKLIIMVTHNPELAEKYANRIITLKDGEITSDSNPYDGKVKTDLDLAEAKNKSKKTKMSFFTALALSFKNLLTKKARTILVAVAGSIGIIGIALISAVSTGFQNYIDLIEHETLTSYPLSLLRESTDITGILLNITGGGASTAEPGKIRENQVLTSMLGNISTNDLKSFMDYLDNHSGEIEGDIRLTEYKYNVDPLIYTIDATGELAKLNPNNLFTSLVGDSSILNSYSSMTSVFEQYELENIKNDTNVIAGRYPEAYNEMVIYLAQPDRISDLLTYSLGFHDTDELSDIVTKILSGESVNIENAPLELTYDDLLNLKLRLVYATDTYKYNDKYNIYEDMSGDESYMMELFNNKSEELKVVGIVAPKDNTFSTGSGVLYLPSLTTHIINRASETEIVKRQLSNPTVDIFSNTKFGDNTNNYSFEFSDLVSVDQNKLASAIKVNIDQAAISKTTAEYLAEISSDITTDTAPAHNDLVAELKELGAGLFGELSESGILFADVDTKVSEYLEKQDLRVVLDKYIPLTADTAEAYGTALTGLNTVYAGLLKSLLQAYIGTYCGSDPLCLAGPVPMDATMFIGLLDTFAESTEVSATFDYFAAPFTEAKMKSEVVSKVLGLTSYITGSFADAFGIDESALLGAFQLNFTEEELTRVVTAMFTKKEATLSSNLSLLGYQNLEDPTRISFYFNSFDAKTHFMEFLDNYNDLMQSYDQDDKVIEYSDTTGVLMSSVKTIVDAVSYVLIAFVSISLVVSSIMIGVITYISVYERTKEIGILRAVGASKHNISNIFNAETFIIGLLSGIFGVVISYLLIPVINIVLHYFTGDIPLSAALDPRTAFFLIILSIILTLLGGLIPAKSASKKDPVEALRSE